MTHNNGYGDDIGHGYHKSSLRKEDVENLANRTDISEEEKRKRKRKLEEEIAAGIVGAGILGYAGYHHHEKEERKEGEGGEKHHHHFGL
jgi:hypothetical protein